MLTFKEIYDIKTNSKLHNALIENLTSTNKGMQQLAMNKIKELNFQNENDVLLFIAMNI